MGNLSTMAVLFVRVVKITSKWLAYLRTNHPALHSLVKAAMEGKGKQLARKATLASPTSSQ